MSKPLEDELKERLHIRTLEKTSRSSGCISAGQSYSTDTGERIFVKSNGSLNAVAMFNGEMESLKAIVATKTLRAPKPILVIHDYDNTHNSSIVMEFIDISPLTDSTAKILGQNLAKLHDYNNKVMRYNERASKWIGGKPPSAKPIIESRKTRPQTSNEPKEEIEDNEDVEEEENQFTRHSYKANKTINIQQHQARQQDQPLEESTSDAYSEKFVPEPNTEAIKQFGFHVPTSCGAVPQQNEWTDDWVSFYARHRLDYTIRALLSDHGDRELIQEWSHLQLKVDKLFVDYKPKGEGEILPCLLHGDLWSGNAAQISDGTDAVVYDPSSFYGHSEYEFGIVRMFGGFSKEFENAYFDMMPKKKLFEKRNELYQLFHHLNHWNHFGSGYRTSSLRIMKDLNAMC